MVDPLNKSALSDNRGSFDGQSEKADLTVGERIKIRLNGRTMEWLARQTGISTSTLSDYGRGKLPRADKAIRIARVLETSVEWLFSGAQLAAAPLIDAQDVDWVMVPVLDMMGFTPEDRPQAKDTIPIRRPWLSRLDSPLSRLFLTALPMDVGDLIRSGEQLLCRDPDSDLMEGRWYVFMVDGNILVRKVAIERSAYSLISIEPMIPPLRLERRIEPHPDEQLFPIARILGRFGLQPI